MSTGAETTAASDVYPKAPIYESSTQYLHWRFSLEQLSGIRIALNTTAVAAIRQTLEVEKVNSQGVLQAFLCLIIF
jgi:hypothetical protein